MLYQETEWFLNLIYTLVLFYLSHMNLSLIYKEFWQERIAKEHKRITTQAQFYTLSFIYKAPFIQKDP